MRRYIVRLGKVRGKGAYVCAWSNCACHGRKYPGMGGPGSGPCYGSKARAQAEAKRRRGRVVAVLPFGTKRFAATRLRKMAALAEGHRSGESYAGAEIASMLEDEAATLEARS